MAGNEAKSDEVCLYCGKENDEQGTSHVYWVQCGVCLKWAHMECAKVSPDVENVSWSCAPCLMVAAPRTADLVSFETPGTSRLIGEGDRVSTNNLKIDSANRYETNSVKSKGSNIRAKNKLKLELKLLEEKKHLEQEFLSKKYELLNELNDVETDEDSQEELATVRNSRTVQWAKSAIVSSLNDRGMQNNFVQQHPQRGWNQSADFEVNFGNTSGTAPVVLQPQLGTGQMHSARSVMPRDLPTFSGKPEEWPLFFSSYQNSTRLCGFSNDENLLRLQRALKGKALESVSSELLIPDMVPEVIATLQMLFGRPDHVINNSIAKLRAQPNVNPNKLETLISFALEVKNLTAAMKATGLEEYGKSPMLVQECVEKLPAQMRLDWAKHQMVNKDKNDLPTLSNWLYTLAEAASTVASNSIFVNNQAKVHRVNFHKEEEHEEAKTKLISCYYCGKEHMMTDCLEFKKLTCEDRWNKARELKLCFSCLVRHDLKFCKKKKECRIGGCTRKHHSLLHERESKPPKMGNSMNVHRDGEGGESVLAIHHQSTSSVLYRVLPITVYGETNSCEIYAFCDDGSGPTMIEDEVLKKLNLDGCKGDLCLRWTNGATRTEKDSKTLDIQVSPRGKKQDKFTLSNVRSVKELSLPRQSLDMMELSQKYKHLRGLPVESYSNVKPQMIIGLSNKSVMMPRKYREGALNEPAATKTRLGWTVFGVTNEEEHHHVDSLQLHICECDDEVALQSLVTNAWKTEEISGETKVHGENSLATLQKSAQRVDDYFVVKLLWKSENITLQDNYAMALRRLKCFERKLHKESDLKGYVNDHIMTMVQKGYARKLTANEIAAEHPRKWYLPIFTVRNPNKPNKIRLVWDAAAEYNKVSLNDHLEKGPDILNSLIQVLFNFRIGKYGVCGDICEMFHRVHVVSEDQQAQRFLWRKSHDQIPDVYVLTVLSFGASCSPVLAQFVRMQNAMDFKDKYPRAAKSIVDRHYVDDMLDSVDTEEEAIQLAKDVRFVHRQGNFHIRNWLSNSQAVIKALGEQGDPQVFCSAGNRMDQIIEPTKVLGVWWETGQDIFCFNLKFTKANETILQGVQLPTKRQLLRLLMSIFDPLGFLSFYLVDMKILFQQIWRSGIGWDDEIPQEHSVAWKKWLQVLPKVKDLKIPRHYFGTWTSNDCDIELHVFVDGGLSAFAAVGYLRIVKGFEVKVVFVGSKSKVTPLRPMSVPRIELMAAVLGARYGNMIMKNHDLQINEVSYWSDSRTVLSWLHSDPIEYKQFVTYRVGEIHEITTTEQWKYVPTKLNPADLATKVMSTSKLTLQSVWFNGPEFLATPKELWPIQQKMGKVDEELRKHGKEHLVAFQSLVKGPIIDYNRFSKWERLLRSVAYVIRYVNHLKHKVSGVVNRVRDNENLTSKQLEWSYNFLCRAVQNEMYSTEISMINADRNCNLPKNSALYKLSPFLDEKGILRMRSRLERANCVGDLTKNPIILPKSHRLTRLIVDWYHRKYKHISHEVVINELFQRYQISGLRQLLRTVRKACQLCKVRNACPQPPEMAALPTGRISPFSRPFTHVGLDFFGPFLTSVGRRSEKRYGVVFTCLTCRAIHIEMAYSLTMSSCSIVIRNFIARRGTPRVFYSDNGTNLKAAERELRESLAKVDLGELKAEFITAETSWEFIPPGSPHMGGAWERMVRSIKHVMYHVVTPETKLTDEKLLNLFLEVESIVNSRPLTYLSLDTADQEALTPNHFLLGCSTGQKPPGKFEPTDQFVKNSWRHSQYLAENFWKRWVAEILPTLTRRTAWFEKAKPIEVGDVVIIVDPNSPRYSWPKGIVVETRKARDGQTRSVVVRTPSGQYHRPAAKIAVLDVKSTNDGLVNKKEVLSSGNTGGRMFPTPSNLFK